MFMKIGQAMTPPQIIVFDPATGDPQLEDLVEDIIIEEKADDASTEIDTYSICES